MAGNQGSLISVAVATCLRAQLLKFFVEFGLSYHDSESVDSTNLR